MKLFSAERVGFVFCLNEILEEKFQHLFHHLRRLLASSNLRVNTVTYNVALTNSSWKLAAAYIMKIKERGSAPTTLRRDVDGMSDLREGSKPHGNSC